MKREIICLDCGKKYPEVFAAAQIDNPGPQEYMKMIEGKALDDYKCDHCVPTSPIKKGTFCIALSVWIDGSRIPYYPWESEYIERQRDGKNASD
mgnify:CR=1 FL=1